MQDSDKFEDILMGACRPSLVVERYQELFSQSRVEAYEAIELLDELEDKQFISEFLLDVLKVRSRYSCVDEDVFKYSTTFISCTSIIQTSCLFKHFAIHRCVCR